MKHYLVTGFCALMINGCFAETPKEWKATAPVAAETTYNGTNAEPIHKPVGEAANETPKKTEELSASKVPAAPVDVFKDLAVTAVGVPSGSSDEDALQIEIKADPKVTFYSYKIGTPADCLKGEGYKVTPVTEKPVIDITSYAPGTVALCLLSFHSPFKVWQTLPAAKVITWQKVSFQRTIMSEYSEYDEFCGKDIVTRAMIEFSGNIGTYSWIKDSRAQGCDQDTESGKDALTISSNNAAGIKGFWAYDGAVTSGWFSFKWSNKERTKFEGNFGYGDPGLEPAGYWNSVLEALVNK